MQNVFEGTRLTFKNEIRRGKPDTQDVEIKFEQQGGSEQVANATVELGSSGGFLGFFKKKDTEAVFSIVLPKCTDTEEAYTIKYWMESAGERYEGKEFKVWPQTLDIACFDKEDEGKALANVRFRVAFETGESQLCEASSEGKGSFRLTAPGPLTPTGASPFVFTKWKEGKDKGRKREAVFEKKKWTAKVKTPTGGKAENAAVKWWVNQAADYPNACGELVKVEVGPEDLSLAVKGDEVHVRVTFPKANSKRSTPKPALCTGEDSGTALTPKKADAKPGVDDLVYEHKLKVAADGENVTFYLLPGVCGLDKGKVEVGVTGTYEDDKLFVETWRKLFYQCTKPEGLTPPALTDAVNGFRKVGIEFEEYTDPNAEIKQTDEASSWFDGEMIEKGKTGKVLVIGTHNIASFKGKYVKKADKKPAAHILYCHFQLDAETASWAGNVNVTKTDQVAWPPGSGTNVRGLKLPGTHIDASGLLFEKAIHNAGDTIVSAKWRKTTGGGATDIPTDHMKIDMANHGNFIHIKLPDAAKQWIDDAPETNQIQLQLRLHWSKGWYAGWCTNGDRHNVIVGTSPAGQVSQTIIHEVGHAIGQTPQTAPPGLEPTLGKPVHPWQYTGRSHSGSHCANGVSKTLYDDSGKSLHVRSALDAAVCAMFGSVTPTTHAEFCPICEPFVKATIVAEVTK